ncbi:MAG: hypothetical protein JSV37_09280 [Anaerolineaceae bacterium]|nr:MAG: hypothetical protein JSV37_09280 [Anaerolineaceae bacterium]
MSSKLHSLNKWVGRIRSSHIYPPIALITLALLFRLLWIVYTDFIYEDAFITFRYAHQIVEGNGFVYNPGERVYGTTTPLFTLLLAGWLVIPGTEVVAGARWIGLASSIGTLFFLLLTLRRMRTTQLQQLFVIGLIGLSSKLWVKDTGGMETPLVIFLMAASWYAYVNRRLSWTGVLCGLLLWTRVDLILWPVTLCISETLSNGKSGLKIAWPTILVYLPWVIFAWLYFSSPIPHTITAKWVAYTQPNQDPYLSHLMVLVKWLNPVHFPDQLELLGIIVAFGVVGVAVWKTSRIYKEKQLVVLPMFVCLEVIRIVISRATIFSRYFTPAFWAVLILLGLGLGSLLIKVRPGRKLLWFSGLVSLIIFLVLGFRAAERVRDAQIYRHDGALKPAGLWLRQNSDPKARVQLEPLGYIGYYAERVMIDEVGLVTPQMVDLKRRGIFELDQYIGFFQPDYILIHCDDSIDIQFKDINHVLTTQYIKVASFNPRDFDPREPGVGSSFDNLGRSSCYEIWGRIEDESP